MTNELLAELRKITPEEQAILDGVYEIEKNYYTDSQTNVVDAGKLLEDGKLIQVRTHTRFVHFPKHTHNYIEVIYMCSGSTRHIINGQDVILNTGELLFLSKKATQEIYPAGRDDIAVNFIILPEFLDYGFRMIEEEENPLRDFIIDCLRGKNGTSRYLHFKVTDVLPIQNLVENLIWTIVNDIPNKRSINQATMGVLFVQLINYMDKMETDAPGNSQQVVIATLSYIEEHYYDGELSKLAELLHYDVFWLSKEIKKRTGRTYTQLVQDKRLSQAAYLLLHTKMSVMDVGMAVGYDNLSYFHRLFQKHYGMTPRKYRIAK